MSLDEASDELDFDECSVCGGCGQIANDEDQTPWTYWENLPAESKLAVFVGLVRPIPCPECGDE